MQVSQQGGQWTCQFCGHSNSNAAALPVLDLQASFQTAAELERAPACHAGGSFCPWPSCESAACKSAEFTILAVQGLHPGSSPSCEPTQAARSACFLKPCPCLQVCRELSGEAVDYEEASGIGSDADDALCVLLLVETQTSQPDLESIKEALLEVRLLLTSELVLCLSHSLDMQSHDLHNHMAAQDKNIGRHRSSRHPHTQVEQKHVVQRVHMLLRLVECQHRVTLAVWACRLSHL